MSTDAGRHVVLVRDCPAVLIPAGVEVMLRTGSEAIIVQTLGGSITVQTDRGALARVSGSDADALGLEVAQPDHDGSDPGAGSAGSAEGDAARSAPPFSVDRVIDVLKTVYDPEIPINVVDLGLVYSCDATEVGDGTYRVAIEMSMTAPGCGMGDVLKEDAEVKVRAVPGVSAVNVELVWDPPWDLSRLSDDARLELGMW